MATSYSTFSIASLIGHEVGAHDASLAGAISGAETTVGDHPGAERVELVSPVITTTTTMSPAPADGVSADDDANNNCGGSHAIDVVAML